MPAITLAPPLSEASITSAGHGYRSGVVQFVEFCFAEKQQQVFARLCDHSEQGSE